MAGISQKRPDCNYKCCQRKPRANAVLTWRMGEDQGKGEKKNVTFTSGNAEKSQE